MPARLGCPANQMFLALHYSFDILRLGGQSAYRPEPMTRVRSLLELRVVLRNVCLEIAKSLSGQGNGVALAPRDGRRARPPAALALKLHSIVASGF
jgi:hypothetical protein